MRALLFFASFFCSSFWIAEARSRPLDEIVPKELQKEHTLVAIAEALDEAYGKDFGGVTKDDESGIVFLFAGVKIPYDDGKEKSHDQKLEDADLEDSFSQIYPLKNPVDQLPENLDPGRIRVEAMFKALYGSTEAEVARSCVKVKFCGHVVRFSARCGAADALEKVGKDLDEVFTRKPELKIYVESLGGTFVWRKIAGTNRLSNHSFANSIDLNVAKSAYWRWQSPATLKTFSRKNWPVEIIEAFERHGFIWGGKWWHYDTMHFEFRPDLIIYSKRKK